MSIVDYFLDFTVNLPREIIRLLKFMKEVDERSSETNKKLQDSQKLYLQNQKSKHDNSEEFKKQQEELYKSINNNYFTALSLSFTKKEILKEIQYLIFDYNMTKLNEIIEKGEKECNQIQANQNNPPTQNNFSYTDPYEDPFAYQNKKKLGESFPGKDGKLLGKKKNRPFKEKFKKLSGGGNNKTSPSESTQVEHFEAPTNGEIINNAEEKYCFCNQPSFGSMVACDNPGCPYQWFHYECVGLKEKPKDTEKWYCSNACRIQAQSKEEKVVKKKKKKS